MIFETVISVCVILLAFSVMQLNYKFSALAKLSIDELKFTRDQMVQLIKMLHSVGDDHVKSKNDKKIN